MTPAEAMKMAIEEGRKGAGFVSPNPLVGCVILDANHQFLAKGYHAKLGNLHAETHALSFVTDPSRLNGAHVFVTLEPCAHEGRQPSCAKHLATLPIASVTYGLQDPNPLVSGQGAQILRNAGKSVVHFQEMQDDLEELCEIFLLNMREKRPFVALKVASSLDGQIALADGTSQWITGSGAREHVHYLRGCFDAVLTGAGTLRKDNPRLNSRDPRFQHKRQRLVILDPGHTSSLDSNSEALKVRKPEDIILVTQPGVEVPQNVEHMELPLDVRGHFHLPDLLLHLQKKGLNSLFVESGAITASNFFEQKCVDRLFLFLAPKLLGSGLSWTSGLKITGLDHAIRMEKMKTQFFGPDLLLSAKVAR